MSGAPPLGRVGIWGFGREGRAVLRWLTAPTPDADDPGVAVADIVVVDDDPARVAATAPDVEVGPFAALRGCDTCFVSPGVRPVDPRRAELMGAGVRLTTASNEFLRRAAARTVGVTGTKGKSTTASFVHALLQAEGEDAAIGGNIGEPLLNLLPAARDAVVVAELSSYQCASLEVSPRVAVVTQLYDDHLVEHGDRDAYWLAKSRIFSRGAQVLVALPETVAKLRTVAPAAVDAVPALVTPPPRAAVPAGLPAHVTDNLRVAVAAAGALLGRELAPATVRDVALAYRPLPHRLHRISGARGIAWVDDALATTQESVLAALDAYPDVPVAVLLGGRDRGQPVDGLVAALQARPDVTVLLVGETTDRFAAALQAAGVAAQAVGTVAAGVTEVAAHRPRVAVCLLSPAAASYDQFRDHRDKAEAFAAAVAALPPDASA